MKQAAQSNTTCIHKKKKKSDILLENLLFILTQVFIQSTLIDPFN